MTNEIKLNGVKIKTPFPFKTSTYNLTKAGRAASGKMKMDIVAKKRKFFFNYDVIDADELKVIMDIIDGSQAFIEIEYYENNVKKSATVYVGEMPKELHRTGNLWYYRNFTFNLIEQ